MAIENEGGDMTRRDFMKRASSAAMMPNVAKTLAAAAAIEAGAFVLDFNEAEAQEKNAPAQKEALALLKMLYEQTAKIRDQFSKIGGGPVGGKDELSLSADGLSGALEKFPALKEMNITGVRVIIEKPQKDSLVLTLELNGKNGVSKVRVPGKPVQR